MVPGRLVRMVPDSPVEMTAVNPVGSIPDNLVEMAPAKPVNKC